MIDMERFAEGLVEMELINSETYNVDKQHKNIQTEYNS